MDNLLKEKIHLSSENSDLKRKLHILDDHHVSAFTDDRSHSLSKSGPHQEKSGQRERDSIASKPLTEEDLQLRNKVMAYFLKRFQKAAVAQLNRSRPS